jgi:hypothetical protein
MSCIIDDLGKGLLLNINDYETVYTLDGNSFTVNGEYSDGEAWINEVWYGYERDEDAGDIILIDANNVEAYRFEDSEEGWEHFARMVLTK